MKGDESAIAFAAYDRGLDVFLANFRGAPPRKCKARQSKRFWKYSFNELGMYDMTALVGKVNCIKEEELNFEDRGAPDSEMAKHEQREEEKEGVGQRSYKLRVVGHSLGGAALLIYLSTAAKLGRDHHIDRMVLLSPAGVHTHKLPLLGRLLCLTDTFLGRWLKRLNFGMTVYGSILRVGAQKFAVDVSSLPGPKGLFNVFLR